MLYVVWNGIRYDMLLHDVECYGAKWHGVVRYHMVWYSDCVVV